MSLKNFCQNLLFLGGFGEATASFALLIVVTGMNYLHWIIHGLSCPL